ncbi:hypothetical protein KSP39_PZI015609 [Platanthera zijinensis]|uniref:Uncharacterized protein n=1 Tax=Platanthera zijinensis TaxID=2320716 RepID=A0AAP0B888_9ASPA
MDSPWLSPSTASSSSAALSSATRRSKVRLLQPTYLSVPHGAGGNCPSSYYLANPILKCFDDCVFRLLSPSRVSARLRHAAAFPKTPFLSIRHVPRRTLLTALPCRWPRRYFPDSSPPPSPTPELMAEPAKRWVPLEANPDVMNQVSLPL